MNIPIIKRYVLLVGIVWTFACATTLISHLRDDYQQSVKRVKTRASAMLERDILYREWVASHGGVYAPVSDRLPPNPYLDFLPERDIETVDGQRLTLVNPSYMTRLVFEQDNRLGETTSKITSLKYLNADNAPDPWERDALLQLERGAEQVSAVVSTAGQFYVRVLRPFYVEPFCLKCHTDQGYQLGDVRGGISVSVPFQSFLSGHWQHNIISIVLFTSLWLVGLLGVYLLGRKLYAQTGKAIETERQREHAEMSLEFFSNFDRRTNLPNRFKFEAQLQDLFPSLDDKEGLVAVIALEIRNYKQIVDNFDYHVGDKLFKIMAERIATLLAPGDSVARFGEDRLLLSHCCSDEQSFTQKKLVHLENELGKPINFDDHDFFPVVCLGVAFYPNDAVDARNLVQKSVSALTSTLENKQRGINLYSQAMQDEAKDRLEIEVGLRRALAENRFELFLQPQVDATSGHLLGAEALLRWQQEGVRYVSPDKFIPIAEENGLILPIGEWVLQAACIQAVNLKRRFGRIITVGVNVSARQFQDQNFVDIVDELLAIEDMSPDMLEIEITEGTFIEDIGRTIEILTDLKVRGLQIAIDDFGTGYSSLSYLNRFPVDRLKIDRSFISDIADNEDDRLLVGLIVDMGRKLGLNVIAEGVEDDMQKHLLIGMGCHAIQGFLFGRPLPFEDFCAWVEAANKG